MKVLLKTIKKEKLNTVFELCENGSNNYCLINFLKINIIFNIKNSLIFNPYYLKK